MGKYFKFVGVLCVIDAIIGLIIYTVCFIPTKPNFFVFLLGFVTIILFAPSFGLALIALGNILTERAEDEVADSKQTNKDILSPEEKPKQATFILSLDNEEYSVKKLASETINVIIPSVHKNKPVSKIENNAFKNCTLVEIIQIPNSILSIGEYAFYECSSLKSITIPNSVTSIGEYAFSRCRLLTSITIPDSVTSIGEYAFKYCRSLTSIKVGNSVTSIGKSVFSDCSSLTSITIPDSVTSIGEYAFYKCISLASVTIPNSITSIGKYSFGHCSSLVSITIPDSVTSIGQYAFNGCSDLSTVYYKGTVEQWNDITIEEGNDKLTIANIIYNYKGQDYGS